MRKFIFLFLLLVLSSFVFAQTHVINNFEDPQDTTFWKSELSENADTTGTIAYVRDTYQSTNSVDGNAMTIDWGTHNIEGWGGYSKIEHMAPDSMVYDWSAYDSITFSFFTETPQSLVGSTHLRFELYEVSDVPDTTSIAGNTEFYYSFHNSVCDDSTGQWHTITMPLQADGNFWNGEGFNRTGWAGVAGNEKFDADKIKGYAFEFSIGGAGEGTSSEGVVIFDELHLHGLAPDPWLIFNGKTLDATLGQFTWGQSAIEVVEGGGIDPQTNALLWTQGDEWANGWSGGGWNVDPAHDLGFRWGMDSVKLAIKAEAGTNSPIRFQFESANGIRGMAFEIIADDQWHDYALNLSDFYVIDDKPDFDSTAITVVQIMGEGNATAGKKVWFDYIWTGNPTIDVVAPAAPTGLAAIGGTYQNLVTWIDVPNEDGTTYTVLASTNPITSLEDKGLELVAKNVTAGTLIATHLLTAPLVDTDLTYYYAVYAVDAAGNDGELAVTDALTNLAKGIATIAPDFTGFAADGDLSEWSEIAPIKMYPEDGSGTVVNNGTIDNNADLAVDAYVGFDDNFLYFAFDVEDDVIDVDSTDGETWMRDAPDLFIGLYNQTGEKHTGYKRGAEPDYHFRFNKHQILFDYTGGGDPVKQGIDYIWKEDFPTGYTVEGRISLDTLAIRGGDDRFHPAIGMKIPIDYSINDADGARREGILTLSQDNQDASWNDVSRWVHTWIGDKMVVGVDDNSLTVSSYALSQNYPNPFNPSTVINYSIANAGLVTLKVYNVIGQEVLSLVNANQNAGQYQVKFDASQLSSGIYIYRIQSDNFISSKKMMLLK
ncbi:MAG: T9SS type A sorting domain-containing protein [Ignavibacteriae bacterium]|nr:T9SS type A sorting domain-containing protein [Ignavibacteriota bacterium]